MIAGQPEWKKEDFKTMYPMLREMVSNFFKFC